MSRRPARAALLALAAAFLAATLASPPACLAAPRHGDDVMLEPYIASLLVDYFETFLREKDIEAFHRNVSARYTEGTLARLARSGNIQDRRAAILALGLIGSFQVNETVARALRDPDPGVRNLAHSAALGDLVPGRHGREQRHLAGSPRPHRPRASPRGRATRRRPHRPLPQIRRGL